MKTRGVLSIQIGNRRATAAEMAELVQRLKATDGFYEIKDRRRTTDEVHALADYADALAAEVAALRADRDAKAEALRPFAGLYEEEWPENTDHNRAVCKRMVLAARDTLAVKYGWGDAAALAVPSVDATADPAEGLPPDLLRVLRDPTIRLPQDDVKMADGRSLWDHLAEWRNAPSNTASAVPSVDATADLSIDTDDNPAPWAHASGQTEEKETT